MQYPHSKPLPSRGRGFGEIVAKHESTLCCASHQGEEVPLPLEGRG